MFATIHSQEFREVCGNPSKEEFIKIVEFADAYARTLRDQNNAYLSDLCDKYSKEIKILSAEKLGLKEAIRNLPTVDPVPQANAEQDAPIHGYLHIITFETGETTKVISGFESHPWGRNGTDFSSEFGHEVVPLVAASKTTPSSGEGSDG